MVWDNIRIRQEFWSKFRRLGQLMKWTNVLSNKMLHSQWNFLKIQKYSKFDHLRNHEFYNLISRIYTYALSFYGSKLFWSSSNRFDRPKSFWLGTNHFGQVQIIRISQEKSNLNLTKIIWTRPKRFGQDPNNLYQSKTIWTNRRTRH